MNKILKMKEFSETDYLFSIVEGDGMEEAGYGDFIICFNPKTYWDNEGIQYDCHIESLLNLPSTFEEVQESMFLYQSDDIKTCLNEIIQLGIKFNQSYHDFMESGNVNSGLSEKFKIDNILLGDYVKIYYPNSIV
jgi:hypothetical protein